jgi:hypothetical protein
MHMVSIKNKHAKKQKAEEIPSDYIPVEWIFETMPPEIKAEIISQKMIRIKRYLLQRMQTSKPVITEA